MKTLFALRQAKIEFVARHLDVPRDRLPLMMKQAGLYSPATKEADIASGLPRLLKAATRSAPGGPEQKKTAQCSHENWAVRSYDRLGYGRCLDCHEQVCLSILLTQLVQKVNTIAALLPHRAERVLTSPSPGPSH